MDPRPTTLHKASRAVARGLMVPIRAYRLLLSPWLGSACRFEPTCSAYALEALERHGAWRGTALAGWRLMRCHPWCRGGCDPVPEDGRFARKPLLQPSDPPSSTVDGRSRP